MNLGQNGLLVLMGEYGNRWVVLKKLKPFISVMPKQHGLTFPFETAVQFEM